MRYDLEIYIRMKDKYPLIPPEYSAVEKAHNKIPIYINGRIINIEGGNVEKEKAEKILSYWTKEKLFEWRRDALEKRYHWVHRHYGAVIAQLYYERESMEKYNVEKKDWPLCDNDIIRYREEEDDDTEDYDDDDADCMNFQCKLSCPFLTAGGCTYENYI